MVGCATTQLSTYPWSILHWLSRKLVWLYWLYCMRLKLMVMVSFDHAETGVGFLGILRYDFQWPIGMDSIPSSWEPVWHHMEVPQNLSMGGGSFRSNLLKKCDFLHRSEVGIRALRYDRLTSATAHLPFQLTLASDHHRSPARTQVHAPVDLLRD